MKKVLFLLLFIYNINFIKGQTIGVDYNNYKIGLNYLQKKDFLLADSFLTKYLESRNPLSLLKIPLFGMSAPYNDIYFNRGIAKLGLKDTASACSDFYEASLYNDKEAFNNYCTLCTYSIDSLFYDKKYKLSSKNKAKYEIIKYFDKNKKQVLGRVIDLKIKPTSEQIEIVVFNNIIATFNIYKQDTIYNILMGDNLPKFKKWNKDYYSYIDSKLVYPEDKNIAYNKYKKDVLYLQYKVLLDKYGKIQKIELFDSFPENIDGKYKDEALRVINETSEYILPGNMFGQNVKCELIFPVSFKLRGQ